MTVARAIPAGAASVARLLCRTILASLLAATRVLGQEACEGGRAPVGTLGLEYLVCVTDGACAVNERDERGWFHWFTVEPVIRSVGAPGKGGGLAVGDVIVAIDGLLITTREGGRRLANVPAGMPVLLRIRRGARELEVALTPVPGCNAPRLTVRER
jgi:S1-C subfamily serine protease